MVFDWEITYYGESQQMAQRRVRAPTAADALTIFKVEQEANRHAGTYLGPNVGDIAALRVVEPDEVKRDP